MKFIKFLFLCAALSFAFVSCNGKSSGKQYDQNGTFNNNSGNLPPSNGSGGGSGAGGGGNGSGGNGDADDDDPKKDICGAVKNKSTKIINGTSCPASGSPVMKILTYTNSGSYLCTGTLIDSDIILTAGHCFNDLGTREDITKVVVVSGSKELEVTNFFVQDNYSPAHGRDLAIVKLKKNVSNIAPVAILTSKSLANGTEIMTFGYGVDENGKTGSLKGAYMKVSDSNSTWLTAAYDTTKTNVCNGDSGGPVIVKVNKVTTIAAITSFGSNSNCLTGDITYFPVLVNSENLKFIKKYASISTM